MRRSLMLPLVKWISFDLLTTISYIDIKRSVGGLSRHPRVWYTKSGLKCVVAGEHGNGSHVRLSLCLRSSCGSGFY